MKTRRPMIPRRERMATPGRGRSQGAFAYRAAPVRSTRGPRGEPRPPVSPGDLLRAAEEAVEAHHRRGVEHHEGASQRAEPARALAGEGEEVEGDLSADERPQAEGDEGRPLSGRERRGDRRGEQGGERPGADQAEELVREDLE